VLAAAVVVVVLAGCGAGGGARADAGLGIVAVPAAGEAAMDVLDDGTPVWVVHHGDGDTSVLDPAVVTDGYPDGPVGLRFLTTWWSGDRRFEGGGAVFDERGTAVGLPPPGDIGGWTGEGTARDMGRYRTEAAGSGLRVVALDAGEERSFADPNVPWPAGDGDAVPFDPAAAGLTVRSLAEAAAQPDGTVSVVDADLVDRDGAVRFCAIPGPAIADVDRCPADGPVARGVVADRDATGFTVWFGPVLVRSEGGGLGDVVSVSAGFGGTG
jgi:hypothetical protein